MKILLSNPIKNKYFEKRCISKNMSFNDFRKEENLKGQNRFELEEQGFKGIESLENFIDEFSENSKLKINLNEWIPNIRKHKSVVDWKSSFSSVYKESGIEKCIFSYEDDNIRLEFSNINKGIVELLFINVQERCKGFGKTILNEILDVCDNLGLILKVLPVNYDVPINMKMTDKEYLKWLRDWYKSFDLISIDKTPNLYYIPSIFIEFQKTHDIENINDIVKFIIKSDFNKKLEDIF